MCNDQSHSSLQSEQGKSSAPQTGQSKTWSLLASATTLPQWGQYSSFAPRPLLPFILHNLSVCCGLTGDFRAGNPRLSLFTERKQVGPNRVLCLINLRRNVKQLEVMRLLVKFLHRHIVSLPNAVSVMSDCSRLGDQFFASAITSSSGAAASPMPRAFITMRLTWENSSALGNTLFGISVMSLHL